MLEYFRWITLTVALAVVAACSQPVMDAAGPGTTRKTTVGDVFVDSKGMTLYTYDSDEPGKSKCSGACAVAWPPVEAANDAQPVGKFTIITRSDGSKQWAFDEMPLYGFIKDSKPGDITGDGDGGVWHVAKP